MLLRTKKIGDSFNLQPGYHLRISVQRYAMRAYAHEFCGKNAYFVVKLHYMW